MRNIFRKKKKEVPNWNIFVHKDSNKDPYDSAIFQNYIRFQWGDKNKKKEIIERKKDPSVENEKLKQTLFPPRENFNNFNPNFGGDFMINMWHIFF